MLFFEFLHLDTRTREQHAWRRRIFGRTSTMRTFTLTHTLSQITNNVRAYTQNFWFYEVCNLFFVLPSGFQILLSSATKMLEEVSSSTHEIYAYNYSSSICDILRQNVLICEPKNRCDTCDQKRCTKIYKVIHRSSLKKDSSDFKNIFFGSAFTQSLSGN